MITRYCRALALWAGTTSGKDVTTVLIPSLSFVEQRQQEGSEVPRLRGAEESGHCRWRTRRQGCNIGSGSFNDVLSSVDSKGLHVWVVRWETKCRSLSRRGVHVGKDVLLRRCGRPRHHVQHVRDETEATIPLPHLKADRLGVKLNDGRKNGDL